MPRDISEMMEAARTSFEAQSRELELTRDRQLRAVVTQSATGTGNIGTTFGLDRKFHLLFVRCHFTGSAGTNPFAVSVDSSLGSAYDTKLFTITQAGKDRDVNLRVGDGDAQDPSAWTFHATDRVRIDWTNPSSGNITWGLEVGLALAA